MREVTCPYCKHVQQTKTKLLSVTCSSCRRNYRIDKDYSEKKDNSVSLPEKIKQSEPGDTIIHDERDNKEAVDLGY